MRLSEYAFPPAKESSRAAGYVLCSAYDHVIAANGTRIIETDLAIHLPPDCYGRIALRTDLAILKHIGIAGGVIDGDYRGNVCVILFNHANIPCRIRCGDRIAHLICERILFPALEEVEQLDTTERADGGFGSTGYK
jgi:dUTP pyrophosphatase